MENVLFDNLPTESTIGVRTVQPNPGTHAIRFALPTELGDLMRQHNLDVVARLVRLGNGYCRLKLKPKEKGEGRRGAPLLHLDGDATRWYAVRMQHRGNKDAGPTHPQFVVAEGLVSELIKASVGYLGTNIEVPANRHSRRDAKVGGQPCFSYDLPTLGYLIQRREPKRREAQTAETEEEQTESAQAEEPEQPEAEAPTEQTGEVPEESIPKGVEVDEPADAKEFSVEGSLRHLKQTLEEANLHIVNLQEKGWTPEVHVDGDGLVRVRVSMQLS